MQDSYMGQRMKDILMKCDRLENVEDGLGGGPGQHAKVHEPI
jgi:hypothetical protein